LELINYNINVFLDQFLVAPKFNKSLIGKIIKLTQQTKKDYIMSPSSKPLG